MLPREADLIFQWVKALDLPAGTPCLNVGSSTADFRTEMQPHVGQLVAKLEGLGLKIVNCDLKAAPGVDEAGDLLDPAFQKHLRVYKAKLLICANLLEHLTDPRAFASACGSLLADGGYGVFSVPRSFPYHPDPIDTMFRPSPEAIAALLPGWTTVRAETIEAGRFRPGLLGTAKELVRVALPFYRPKAWWPRAHHLLWLFRPYQQSMVLMQKSSTAKATRKPAASGTRRGRR